MCVPWMSVGASARRAPFVAWLWVVGWLVVGCEDGAPDVEADAGSDEGEDVLSPVEAVDAFCRDLIDVYCGRTAVCGCGAEAEEACRTDGLGCIPGVPAVRDAIEAGEIGFDALSAQTLVDQLRASSSCGSLEAALGWTVGDLLTWGGTLMGTIEPGEECRLLVDGDATVSACREGLCLAESCAPVRGPEMACGEETLCLHMAAPPATFWDGTARSICDETSGLCLGPQPEDGPCSEAIDCQAGFCDGGRCAPLVAMGGRCYLSSDCVSTYCDIARSECATPLAQGVTCIADTDCQSGFCRHEEGSATGACEAPAELGSVCDEAQPAGCESGVCVAETCVEPICLGS